MPSPFSSKIPGSRTVNRVTKYDCEMRRWSSAQSMNLARRWGAAVGLGNTLYVIGGIGGRGGTYERRLVRSDVKKNGKTRTPLDCAYPDSVAGLNGDPGPV